MIKDCKKLSPNALKIFEQIKACHHPSDLWWGNLQWTEDGKVYADMWYDLRKKKDREKLTKWYEWLIGKTIVMFASSGKKKKLTPSAFSLRVLKRWIEVAVLLHRLDFQIETMDLVEA